MVKALAEDDEEAAPADSAPGSQRSLGKSAAQSASAGGADSSDKSPKSAMESSVEPFGALRRDLFPSVVLATATIDDDGDADEPSDATHYGDRMSWAGVLIRNAQKGDRYTVEVESEGVIKPSKVSFVVNHSERLVTAAPKLKFDFEALGRITQTRPINLTFRVIRNDRPLEEMNQTWQIHQINDCPYMAYVPAPKKNGKIVDEPLDIRFMFAAYVNENHPHIDQVLKEAKATGLCDSFHGYQGTEQDVLRQVNAVWVALQRRGISYSSITNTTPSKGVYTQHVRFLDESISATQANCVDGSVLMASVLKKLEIKTCLVLVPGHCYLAFYSQEPDKGGRLYGIETTMMGNRATLPQAIEQATVQAPSSLAKNAEKFDQENSGYLLIDLDGAREAGIMPIPFVKTAR